ncbi:hypothetical protein CF336_g2327 [Tilletia laevis]|nr:hypothetical protein CF336_g2327 [Tilletia laevis]
MPALTEEWFTPPIAESDQDEEGGSHNVRIFKPIERNERCLNHSSASSQRAGHNKSTGIMQERTRDPQRSSQHAARKRRTKAVQEIAISVKADENNRLQPVALAIDVLSFVQGLLQSAKDASIRLSPGTAVANTVIRLKDRLKVILEKVRICQDLSTNSANKAFRQFVTRDEVSAILSNGRNQ